MIIQGNASPKAPTVTAAPGNRTDRFMARIESHLPTLADDAARVAFLDTQIASWERRYSRFIATEGDSEPVTDKADPPTAFDFVGTITALTGRRQRLQQVIALRSDMEARRPFAKAIMDAFRRDDLIGCANAQAAFRAKFG
jgi:hypothetical protein